MRLVEDLVDPELRAALPSLGRSWSEESLAPLRRQLKDQWVRIDPHDPLLAISEHTIDDAEGLKLFRYAPRGSSSPSPALLFIHGGGLVAGSPESREIQNRQLALDLGWQVFAVAYRLAPESRYPAALQDCFRALVWLHANAANLNIRAEAIGLKGDSAGGGLAAALSFFAGDRGGPPVAFQHLTAPMLDDRTCIRQQSEFVGQNVWTVRDNAFGWQSYLGTAPGSSDVSPFAAPGRQEDVSNAPPTFISVGSLDLFLAENLEFVAKLSAAGVPVEAHIYPGAYHGFERTPDASIAREARRNSVSGLRRLLSISQRGNASSA